VTTFEPAFYSPWIPSPHYWLVFQCADTLVADRVKEDFAAKGFTLLYDSPLIYGAHVTHPWVASFAAAAEVIKKHGVASVMKSALIPAQPKPLKEEVELTLRSYIEIEQASKHIWLMEAMLESRLICFMQRVMDKRGKVSGFEAFARIEDTDGKIRDGGAIILASRMLNVEFQLDRMLHKEAVLTFIGSDSEGYLFINFLTGFIHRPERYLDGLSQAVERFGLMPRHIVLDISIQPPLAALKQLQPTVQYCRSRGFSIAVDDVMTPDDLRIVLHEIKPDFVKLDGRISRGVTETRYANLIMEMVRLSHEAGATVVAEGVEAGEQHQRLAELGVDLFQGYLFGAPEQMKFSKNVDKIVGNQSVAN
jgi:EAL domain-containing protein (putative c-di-GMP-specific phosphodiesterase class I)